MATEKQIEYINKLVTSAIKQMDHIKDHSHPSGDEHHEATGRIVFLNAVKAHLENALAGMTNGDASDLIDFLKDNSRSVSYSEVAGKKRAEKYVRLFGKRAVAIALALYIAPTYKVGAYLAEIGDDVEAYTDAVRANGAFIAYGDWKATNASEKPVVDDVTEKAMRAQEQRSIIKTNGYYRIESDPVYNRLRIETPTLMIESVSADDESAVRELYELYEQLVAKDEQQYIEQLADDIWRLENMTPSFEGIEELKLLERQQMAHKRAWLQSRIDAAPAARLDAARELLAKRDESE